MEVYFVVMLEGEWDLIFFVGGKLFLGVIYENDMGFDLMVDEILFQKMEEAVLFYYLILVEVKLFGECVGICVYISDFFFFFGEVLELLGVYLVSGLGLLGFIMGFIIGYYLV